MNRTLIIGVAFAAACAGQSRQDLYPIPEQSPAAPDMRGTETAARAISGADEASMITEIIRTFYRPSGKQARWIDARPLAHRRTLEADTAMAEDEDRATMLAQATALRRVCALDEKDFECRGRPGGVLRFSAPYAAGRDSAVVYVRYAPVQAGPTGEIEFRMVRDEDGWRIAGRRSLATPRASATP